MHNYSQRRSIAVSVATSVALLLASSLGSGSSDKPAASPVTAHGELSVTGNRILDGSGRVFSVTGPSLFWGNKGWSDKADYGPDAYYNADVVAFLRREWNVPIVRIAMGAETPGGYIADPAGRWQKIAAVADAAIDEGMYFIVDWHSHHAEDHTAEAIAFFERVANAYGQHPNLIYEIYNEPLNTTDWATVIKPYAEQVIAAIRAIDKDNLILVGSQTWSQDVDKVADDPIEGFTNIAYTLHFYAGTHGQGLRDKAQYALDNGIALLVSEWGSVNATGDGAADVDETRRWVEFMRKNELTHLNWSLHSKDEGASILKPGSPPNAQWTDENFTVSGLLFRDIVHSWHHFDYSGDN
jgi:endoglucanase